MGKAMKPSCCHQCVGARPGQTGMATGELCTWASQSWGSWWRQGGRASG